MLEEKQKYPDVIALSCSPSRGRNSDTMLDSFVEGFKENSNHTVEKVYLYDIPIDDFCFENRLGASPHEEKFKELCEKIMHAKALIIATPTYNFSVPARLKNFIDRIRFFALDFQNKSRFGQPGGKLEYLRVYFVVSGGTPHWAQKMLFFAFPPFWLRGVFLYYGAHCLGAIYSGDVSTFQNSRMLNTCKRRGARFAVRLKKCHENAFLERIFFRPPDHSSHFTER